MSLVIAIDTETHLITPDDLAPKVVCLSWAFRRPGPKAFRHTKSELVVGAEVENWMKAHLEIALAHAGEVLLVGHNMSYDMACICRTFPALEPLVFATYSADEIGCTEIREKLLDIAEGTFRISIDEEGTHTKAGYALADIVKKYQGKDLAKGADTWRLKYAELDGIPKKDWPKEAVDYAIGDAEAALAIYDAQKHRAESIGYALPTQYLDARADFALRKMSVHGIRVDQDRVEQEKIKAQGRILSLINSLKATKLISVSGGKQKGLFDRDTEPVVVKKNLEAIRAEVETRYPGTAPRTEKGWISTAKDTLSACKWEPFDELLEYSALEKLLTTYFNKLDRPYIHASFVGLGAASGRTSCHAPNLQNQPRAEGVRECFVPRPGYVFLTCDFDSQEMRTLAQSCLDLVGHSRLAERYQQDAHYDPHMEFARRLAGGEEGNLKALRQQAKACNFGYPGGLGDETLVDYAKNWGVEITEDRAKELRAEWLNAWPEMRDYFAHVGKIPGIREHVGVVEIPQSKFRRAGLGYTDGCNTYFQTLAAHASKEALWEVTKKCFCGDNSYLIESRPVIFLHDEIILETPDFAAEEAAKELEETMVAAMNKWTPNVPSAAKAKAMERWQK